MKKAIIWSFVILLNISFLFYKTGNVFATGGTYSCIWQGSACADGVNNCVAPCYKQYSCSNFAQPGLPQPVTCQTAHSCLCPALPTSAQGINQLYSAIQTLSGRSFSFNSSGLGDIVRVFVVYIFPIFGLVLLLFILYGGYNLMLSGGDPKKAQSAKSILTTAFVGFIIIFTSYWIVQIVARILGLVDITNIFRP